MGNQLKHDIREYMRTHPGTKYTEARNAVLASPSTEVHKAEGLTLLDALGDTSPEAIAARWKATEFDGHLRIPVGFDTNDERLIGLDLGEYAVGGDGPHGCVQGSSGTGKTVLLWNMLLALAAQNSPTKLNIVLGQGLGVKLTSHMRGIPHMVDLERSEPYNNIKELVSFVTDEMRRRQEFLAERDARGYLAYTSHRADNPSDETLPILLVVVDDFIPALIIDPNSALIDMIINVARKGRALGVHLLLCEERMDDAQLSSVRTATGFDVMTFIGYGVSLKVDYASSSRAVLGTNDAVSLPQGTGDSFMSRRGDDGCFHVTSMRTLQLESHHEKERAQLKSRISAAYKSYRP